MPLSIIIGLGLCFILDLSLSLGVAGGIPYLFVLVATYFYHNTKALKISAVSAIALVVLGIALSPKGDIPYWIVYANRLYSVLAIIVVTPLLVLIVDTKKRMEDSSNQLAQVINTVSAALIGVDKNGRVVLVNPSATELFGYSRLELMWQPIEILIPKEFRGVHSTHREGFLKTLTPRSMGEGRSLFGLRKDGSQFPLEIGLTPVPNHADIEVLATIVDLSTRVELEAEQRWLAAIVGFSGDAIFSKSLDGVIESWNKAAEQLYGYTAEEIIGQSVSLLIPSSEAMQMEDILRKIRKDEKLEHFTTKRCHKDGWILDISLSVSPIKNTTGQIVGAACIARDITAMKMTEATLRMLNRTLARSNEEQERFVSIAAHDLKEPLRNMRNLADMIRSDCKGLLPEQSVVDLQDIGNQATRMTNLVDELRRYAKIGSEEGGSTKVDCHEVIDEFCQHHALFMTEHHAKVEVQGTLPKVFMLPEHVSAIFRNLIINGLKYNESQEKTVCITGRARFEMAEFTVTDNGIGIPDQSHEHIFTMFKRAHSGAKFSDGSGAGLAIVKKIVEQYAGTIDVKSSSNEGTMMRFTLPTEEQQA
tara:strand:- start:70 stop:1839 length:1770 start_codon:yes stop_codon:yes gene_type:complete